MKIEDASTTVMTSVGKRKRRSLKTPKYHQHLTSQLNHLFKDSLWNSLPLTHCQIIPITPLWTHSLTENKMAETEPMAMSEIPPVPPSFQPFVFPKVTTTLVPLNVGPSESSKTVQTTFTPTINRVDKACIESFKATVTTHQIGNWVIRESSQPFQHETKPPVISVPKINPKDFSKINKTSSSNVKKWNIDDVCLFFEEVLGKPDFTPIIQEHLIDGFALLLLQDVHLEKIFKMQLGPRLKVLNRIEILKSNCSD